MDAKECIKQVTSVVMAAKDCSKQVTSSENDVMAAKGCSKQVTVSENLGAIVKGSVKYMAKKPASVERGRVSERGNACAQPSLCMSEKTLKKVCDENSDENSGERFLVMASAGHSWGVPEQSSWTMS